MTGRERVLRHLRAEPVDRLPCMPITMQFAAVKAGVAYARYAFEHRALAEAQLAVAEGFGFDHVSAISDPAREAADLGASIVASDDAPPAMDGSNPLLRDKALLADLPHEPFVGPRMTDRLAAVQMLRDRVGFDLLVEGWIEGPCAEAANLRGLNALMTDFVDDPDFVEDVMDYVVEIEKHFALLQIDAGADIIGIGDAAASLIGRRLYERFVEPRQHKLVRAIHEAGALVRLHICGNTRAIVAGMGRTESDIVDLDYLTPVRDAREAMGPTRVLLGNLDPVSVVREGRPATIEAALGNCHREAGAAYIVGAGCEIPRDTPDANVAAMSHYAATHQPGARGADGKDD